MIFSSQRVGLDKETKLQGAFDAFQTFFVNSIVAGLVRCLPFTAQVSALEINEGNLWYLGWFQADPWTLDPLPYTECAERYVKLMGGGDAVVAAARKAVEEKEYTWAAELLPDVIRTNHTDMEARNLKVEAYRQWAYTLTNVYWRNWSLTAAAELDGDIDLSGGFSFTSPDVIQAFPSSVLLKFSRHGLIGRRARTRI